MKVNDKIDWPKKRQNFGEEKPIKRVLQNLTRMLKKLMFFSVCGSFFIAFPLAANNDYGPYQCLKTNEPIKIDGKLNEKIWDTAKPIKFRGIANGETPKYNSVAKMLWDDKYLYVGMEFKDPNVWGTVKTKGIRICGGRKSSEDDEAEIMSTDCFAKIFLDPDADGVNYVEFHINPLNSIYDGYFNCGVNIENQAYPNREYHWGWTCHKILSAVNIDGTLNNFTDTDKGWSFEMAIPWHELQLFTKGSCPPKPGDIWKGHLGRVYKAGPYQPNQYWTWPVLGLAQCHIPEKWETVQFSAGSQKLPEEKVCRIGWAGREKDIAALVGKAHELGFNIIISHGSNEYLNQLCAEAQKYGIDIFYWFHIIPPKGMEKYSQAVSEKEREISEKIKHDKVPGKHKFQFGGEPVNPEEVHTGEFLCFHRPEVIAYSKDKLKKVIENCPQLKGVALDFIGYKNYKCCRCPVSMRLFEAYYNKFIKPRNIMSREKALEQFSLDTMADFNNRLAEYVRDLKPGMKTAAHIYPTFLVDPIYGNRLDIDYCCQTVAWYFEPFWDLKKVAAYTNKVIKDEKRYFPRSKGIPFVGIYMDRPGMSKPPERFRKELKTIREQGCRSFSICPFNIFLKHPELGKIVIEELNKDSAGKN